jgi:hypothetical protein
MTTTGVAIEGRARPVPTGAADAFGLPVSLFSRLGSGS